MNSEAAEMDPELVEDLCRHYRELERCKALHLDISELMLAAGDPGRREWIQAQYSDDWSGSRQH